MRVGWRMRIARHLKIIGPAGIHKLHLYVGSDVFDPAVDPLDVRDLCCRVAGGMIVDFIRRTEPDVNAPQVSLPAGLARRGWKMQVRIRDAPIMFFLEFIFG